jgi:DNA replication protein DnaC
VSGGCPHGACDGSGFLYDPASNTATPCRCRPRRIARARARQLSAVIPRRYRGVSFDRAPVVNMDDEVVRLVREFTRGIERNLDQGNGLCFVGDVGTGKTTLAMLVSKTALEAGRTVAIYSLPRLLTEIRMTFDDSARRSHTDLLDRLATVDLLHIDDLGAENTTPWVLEELYSIINGRYEDERSIVVTTNLGDPDQLRDRLGERTMSRLTQMCQDVPLFGRDRRKPEANPAA